jgi:molecular chaperone Hsp33
MTPPEPAPSQGNEVEVAGHFVRHRNAMALFADLTPVFEDLALHQMQTGVRLEPEQQALLEDALATLTLFLASRPQNEAAAWTVNLREPPLNVFVTGDSQLGNVVGRVFTEDVKTSESNLFFAQLTRPPSPPRQSTVEVVGRDMLSLVEQFHDRSEQFPARVFRQGEREYAMVVAHPDIDLPWLVALDQGAVARLADDEELSLLERRRYRFGCGCDAKLVAKVVGQAFGGDVEAILAGEESLEVQCPRCGGVFQLDRPALERYLSAEG